MELENGSKEHKRPTRNPDVTLHFVAGSCYMKKAETKVGRHIKSEPLLVLIYLPINTVYIMYILSFAVVVKKTSLIKFCGLFFCDDTYECHT